MSDKAQADYSIQCCHCDKRYWYKIDSDKLWSLAAKYDVLRQAGWKYDETWPAGFVCPDCIKRESPPGQGD